MANVLQNGSLETCALYCEENLDRLAKFPADCIDLVYLDPPFFSNRRYEVIWGDESEVRSFSDRWQGGINHYIEWMRQRALQMHRVLKPTGSFYLHCDPAASHYLKVMLDGIFGLSRFRSEIIWKRTSAHSDGRQGRRLHGRVHDVLLFYTKGDAWTWNPVYTPYDPEYVDGFYKYVEEGSGRRYRLGDLTGPGGESKGNPRYEVMGVTRYWRYSKEKMEALIAEGRVVQTKPGAVPAYKRYLDEGKGIPLQDVWSDVRPIGPKAAERQGYPTQKPERLMDRIIATSSNRDDIVLDGFCGCGTTLAVAEKMHRRWIGIDISPTAVRVVRRRMDRLNATFSVYGLPETEDALRTLDPFEFQNWIIDSLHATHAPRKVGDMGIDGYSFFERLPIQVKRTEKVGREVVDIFETAIRREGKRKGYIIAFSFSKGAVGEAARVKAEGLEIGLVEVRTLLDNPTDKPLRPGLDELTADLLVGVREAARRGIMGGPPRRSAEELVASGKVG